MPAMPAMPARPCVARIVHAARKSQSAYQDVQLKGVLISDPMTDCQVVVGRDEDPAPDAFVAFRGTTSAADWSMNSRAWLIPSTLGGGAKVHSGFVMQWESVKGRVFDELAELAPERILLTGHSLGGACAMIASTDVIARFPGVPVELVTFGAPRCGNVAYSEAVAVNVSACTRVVHDNDVVPSMPSVALGYAHSNTEWVHLVGNKVVWKEPRDGWWYELGTRWSRLMGRELGVLDHKIERYIDGCN